MKTLVIATAVGLALLLSVGVLAVTSANLTFALGQSGTSSGTNTGSAGSGGTAGNAGNGGIAVGDHASANGGSAEANAGSINVQAIAKLKASCDNSQNPGTSGNSC